MLSLRHQTFAQGPQILPTETGSEGETGGAIPHNRTGPLGGYAHTGDCTHRLDDGASHVKHGPPESRWVKLHEAGGGRVRGK
jgi:hypothetical protein